MKNYLIFLFTLQASIFSSAYCQINDDFSDGNFSDAPAWTGDVSNFIVNVEGQLQLSAPAVDGQSFLATSSNIAYSAEWLFYVKLDFKTSATSYMDVYLVSDNVDLLAPLNGYFVRIGNKDDEVSLYRQDGAKSSAVKIIDGLDKRFDVSAVEANIKVTKNDVSEWELQVDPDLSGNFIAEDTAVVDSTHLFSSHFGVFCKYIASRSTLYYFDNLVITGDTSNDHDSPQLDSLVVKNDSVLWVYFNEHLSENTLGQDNFFVNNGIGNPELLEFIDSHTVSLTFLNRFPDKEINQISIHGVEDLFGNALNNFVAEFTYFAPYILQFGDILVSEIMADPTPEVDLPEYEYLELFNPTSGNLKITGMYLVVGNDSVPVPDFSIGAGEFVILCQSAALEAFQNYGDAEKVSNWPSLNNRGERIALYNENGDLIYEEEYSDSWYQSSEKSSGGWSLEMIDADYPELGFPNWRASMDISGGTPGRKNSIDGELVDFSGPVVVEVSTGSDHSLILSFDEPLIDSVASKYENYSVDRGIGSPVSITIKNDSTVIISFDKQFLESVDYSLTVGGIRDLSYNLMSDSVMRFNYIAPYLVRFGDILISEIFADPSPEVDLPGFEFIELFNPKMETFEIASMLLVVGNDSIEVPDFHINAGEYLILCESRAVGQYQNFGVALKVPNWPTLNNQGERISLCNSDRELVFTIDYDDSWYQSIEKEDGGWSLEMIDTDFPCKGRENWRASADPAGGTPGKTNASADELTDLKAPEIIKIIATSDQQVLVTLDEKIPPAVIELGQISANPDLIVSSSNLIYPDLDKIDVQFCDPMLADTEYTLKIRGLYDCAGNATLETSATFVLPSRADSLDVIINEILFNPWADGVDFVELYNQSEKYIDLKGWELGNNDTLSITEINHILEPGAFLVLTENFNVLDNHYPGIDQNTILEVERLTPFNDDEGDVRLMDGLGKTMDCSHYREDYHSPFIRDAEGISLERISFDGASDDPDNWQSASETSGFATPGKMNSQYFSTAVGDEEVIVEPQVFDPGNAGADNFTMIRCRFDQPGNMASIRVLDAAGRQVKTIADHQSVGIEEDFKWEGENDNGEEVRMGYYIVYMEVYNASGSVKIYRKKVVVGGSL
jgi:hypothetical protein